ncbi:MAG: hypothetical protein GXC72_00005, partial [Chitinophagaceae bacterium]|nr:hypothetical protein [Chitinophagaceae bacterium]
MADPISGPSGGCRGSSITLTHTISGGIWSSSNTSVASVNAFTGVVNLVGNGTATIYYIGLDGFFPFIVSKSITVASVTMKADVIECNNGVISFNATDTYYGVTYSNTGSGNSYLWNINSSGSYTFQGSSNATSQYPRMQLTNGFVYTVSVQYTTGGVTCTDAQVVYKSVTASSTILNSHDTTVCYNTNSVNLSGSVSPVTNSYSWSTSGTGSFSSTNALNTIYTPSIADKNKGFIKIYFSGSSSYNSNGNCGSSNTKDSITLRFYTNNIGTDTSRTICSGQALQYNPFSAQSGSTFTWSSSVISGSATGNSANGTGNINDLLINSSASSPAVVRYTITPAYAGCTGTPFTLTATVQPNPTLSITNNSTAVCNSTAVNIQLSSSISGSLYSWTSSVISGTASGNTNRAVPASGSSITDVLLNSSTNNATVRYVIKTSSPAGCTGTDSTTVLVRPLPSVANAGPDQTLCNISSLTLSGNTPAVGTGSWAQVSGPSTIGFANAANPTTSASGFTPGTYVFTWTISNAPCSNSVDTVVIVVSPQTVSGTLSTDATVCSGSNSGTLTLSGYTGAVIRWEFSTDNGGNWSNIASNANSYGYSNLTTTTQYRALVQSSPCSNMYSNTVTITVNTPTVPGTATGVATVCSGSNTGNITLSGFTGSVIRWESSTDGISWPTSYPVNTGTYTYSNLTATTYFRAVVQNGVCANAVSNAVLITVNPVTIPGSLGNDATVCANVNSGSLNLSGNNGTITGWEYSINNGGSWNSITNTSSTYNYNNLAATTIFRVAVQSGVCNPAYSNYATITVVPPVSLPNAGTDTAVCNLAAAPLHASLPASGSGLWSFISGPSAVSFSNTADPNAIVNSLTTGTYQFEWTLSNGVCTNLKDTVQLIVYPATVPGVVSAGSTVCAGTNSATLTLSAYTGNITGWQFSTDNGTTWNNIANTTNTITVNNLTTTTQYRASVQSGVCNTLYSTISTITVLQPVTTANAGPDMQLCAVASTPLQGNTPTSGTGTWAALPGNPSTVTFSNPNNPTTTVNGLVPGTYQFEWTISNGVCTDSKDIVVVTIDPMTVPGTLAAGQTVCATGNSGSISLTGYTGNINNWEWSDNNGTSWNTIANNTVNHTFNNLTTTTLFRAIVKSGSCAALPSNTVTITVLPPPTTANAGTDFAVCNVTATALSANTPTSGTGTWTALPGNPSTVTFTNPNNPNTTVNGLVPGTYQFEWTISNGACTDSKDTVQLIVYPATVPGVVSAGSTVCAGTNSATLTLSAYTGNITGWQFSTDNGTTWNNIANTTNTITVNNLTTTTQYRASVQSGVCNTLYSTISTITVLQPVTTANAGPDMQLCAVASTPLQGNTPTSGTGTWAALPGNPSTVTFSNPNNPTTTVNGLVPGTYQFEWTISNGVCTDSKDIVVVTIDPMTVPGTLAAGQTVCATGNSGSISLTGYTGNINNWEWSDNNGTSWNTIANNTVNHTFNNLTTTTLFRAIVKSGSCAALPSNTVTITVLPPPTTANAGTDFAVCNVTATALSANTPTSGTGTWTALPGNPSTVTFTNPNNPNTTVNGLVPGTYQFEWTISNGACTDSKDTVQVTIVPATTAGILGTDATVCATANSGTLTLTGNNGQIVQWEQSSDYGSNWVPVVNTTNTLNFTNLSSTTQYRVSVKNDICPAQYSNISVINVLPAVTIANAGPDTTFINGVSSYMLQGNVPINGTGTWSVVPGANTTLVFSNYGDPHAVITGLDYIHGTPPTDGYYHLVWTISNGVCGVSRDTMQITVQPPTNPGVVGPDAIVCTGNNDGSVQLSDYLGTILQWEYSINGGANWIIIPRTVGANQDTLQYHNLTTTTLFRALVKNGVGEELYSGVAATVTVLQEVTPSNAGPDQTLCFRTSTSLAANMPTSGIGTWTALPGSPSIPNIVNPADPNTIVSGLTVGTYQFVWTISNGLCSDSQDTVTIIVVPQTVAGTLISPNTVCATGNTGTLSFSGHTGSILGTEYSTDNGSSWTMIPGSAGMTAITYNNLTTTTQYRTTVQNFVCPALPSNIV